MINYRKGTRSSIPDALSRCLEYAAGEGDAKPKPLLSPKIVISSLNALHPLLVKQMKPGAQIPIRGSDVAAGVDLMANEELTIAPHQRTIIGTGISIATPKGTYARIAPRSGREAKY